MNRSIYVNLSDGEGIMVFTENEQVTEERIMAALLQVGMDVMEVYEVPEHEVSFYVYDPVFHDAKFESGVLRNAEKWYAANPGWTM